MHYYKRHIGDYAAATRHLSLLEHGVYNLLLDMFYINEAPLPADEKEICRKLGARSKDELAAVHTVLVDFFVLRDDGWHQSRCEAEIAAHQAKGGANRANGARGGRPRKRTEPVPDGNPQKTQSVSENENSGTLTTNQEPLTTNQYISPSVLVEPRCVPAGSDDDGLKTSENRDRTAWQDATAPGNPAMWASVFGDEWAVQVSTAVPSQWCKFEPLAVGWCAAGVTVGQMRRAVERARADAVEPIAYLPGYADRVLASMVPRQARAPLAVVQAVDPDGRAAVEAEGVAKGIGRWDELREQWHQYRARVRGGLPQAAPTIGAILARGVPA